MPVIPVEVKVQVMEECLRLVDVEEVAARHGVNPDSVRYWFKQKLKPKLIDILANEKPGPKPQPKPAKEEAQSDSREERPAKCDECGGTRIWKNGTYQVINWVWLLTVGWLVGLRWILIQRWRCAQCGHELTSDEQRRQAEARRVWWQQVCRLIGLSRFKLGLSVRKTRVLIAFQYGRTVSVGFIQRQTQWIGQRARSVLERLNHCRQKVARFLLFDETFPKLGKRAYRLGVVICEYGLIRSVRTLRRKAQDIPAQLRAVVGGHYQPEFFLTDLDVTYGKYKEQAGLELRHLRDIVHLMRQIIRLFDDAVREVTLDVPKGLPYRQRKKQRALKQRLKLLKIRFSWGHPAHGPAQQPLELVYASGHLQRLAGERGGIPQLLLQLDAVGDGDDLEAAQFGQRAHLAHQEDHCQALAGALCVPDDAAALIGLAMPFGPAQGKLSAGLAVGEALNGFVNGAELLVARHDLDRLPGHLSEQRKVADDVKQVNRAQHPRDEHLLAA